jgi:hypothetical protein
VRASRCPRITSSISALGRLSSCCSRVSAASVSAVSNRVDRGLVEEGDVEWRSRMNERAGDKVIRFLLFVFGRRGETPEGALTASDV